MAVLIVQLTDLHFKAADNSIERHRTQLTNCILQHCGPQDLVVLALTGDFVDRGTKEGYNLAYVMISELIKSISAIGATVHTICVPGNHDHVFEGDQTARDLVITSLTTDDPKPSILSIVTSSLDHYFTFQEKLCGPARGLTKDCVFFAKEVINYREHSIQFNLVNTAWMCKRKDSPGSLHFPASQLQFGDTTSVSYVITLLHHPFNWLSQPDSMRPVRDKIETNTDAIFFGHEHVAEHFDKVNTSTVKIVCGSALQDADRAVPTGFHIMLLDFEKQEQGFYSYVWDETQSEFRRDVDEHVNQIVRNFNREGDRFAIHTKHAEWLDDIELPFAPTHHAIFQPNGTRTAQIRLSQLFTFPDLREYDQRHATGQFKRLHGHQALERLLSDTRILITGFEKSGKTSLGKKLFLEYRKAGLLPILLTPDLLGKVCTEAALLSACGKACRQQYRTLKEESFWQLEQASRVLIVDDVHDILTKVRSKADLEGFLGRFGRILFIGESELSIAELRSHSTDALLFGFHRYHVCEFGHILLEELVRNWLHVSRPALTSEELNDELHRICHLVERVLSLDAIPHQPWVLLALIQQTESNDEIAAKNGSYGHLFQSVVTAALSRSTYNAIDIPSKYTYLAECAYFMLQNKQVALDEGQAKEFHEKHLSKYEIPIDFDRIIKDLDAVRLIGFRDGEIYFRTKYAFCFFVAWHFAEHIHYQATRDELRMICRGIHQSDIANIIVFLAHLSSDPIILDIIKELANSTFKDAKPVELGEDLGPIASYGHADFLKLIAVTPEQHHQAIAEIKDERLAHRETKDLDGRAVQLLAPAADNTGESEVELQTTLSHVRTAIKSIQILGQILRNGAGAIPGNLKSEIVVTIFSAARRLLGELFKRIPEDLPTWATQLAAQYRDEMPFREGDSLKVYQDEVAEKVSRHVNRTAWFTTYAIILYVADSCGLEILDFTFRKVVDSDPCTPNTLFNLAIKLDRPGKLPKEEAISFFEKLENQKFCQSLVKSLVIRHLQRYRVDHDKKQSIAKRMDIPIVQDKSALDTTRKRLGRK